MPGRNAAIASSSAIIVGETWWMKSVSQRMIASPESILALRAMEFHGTLVRSLSRN